MAYRSLDYTTRANLDTGRCYLQRVSSINIVFTSNSFSLPPIEYNAPNFEMQRVRVYANGRVTVSISMQLQQVFIRFLFDIVFSFEKCHDFDLSEFPFDVQRCNSTYGTWTYHNKETSLDAVHDDANEMIKHLRVCVHFPTAKTTKQMPCSLITSGKWSISHTRSSFVHFEFFS